MADYLITNVCGAVVFDQCLKCHGNCLQGPCVVKKGAGIGLVSVNFSAGRDAAWNMFHMFLLLTGLWGAFHGVFPIPRGWAGNTMEHPGNMAKTCL